MPAKDKFHDEVVAALITEGWTITDDPLRIGYGGQEYFVDLGAERNTIAAEKDGQKIAVEIKSFLNRSVARDIQAAVGQYNLYRDILEETQPERPLYMAVPEQTYETFFEDRYGQFVIKRQKLKLIVYDAIHERIKLWIP